MRRFDFGHRSGFGVIAGAASDRRECWDFDCGDVFQAFTEAATACGLGTVVDRIVAGYCDTTPGGGRRILVGYPSDVETTDLTLARRPGRDGEPKIKTLIELPTFAIVAPSNGNTHPSGKPYVRVSGGFDTIASYTRDERDALIALARSFDQMPRTEVARSRGTSSVASGDRPGDDYNRRMTWPQILEPTGWTRLFERGDVAYWRRPGKRFGISATTNFGGSDLFYPFTSSTEFEAETSYSKFGVYAALEHAGDFSKAALALSKQGYGEQNDPPAASPIPLTPSTPYTLSDVERTFARWIRDPDPIPTRAVLAAYVANRKLDGDPVWIQLVGGSGVGKTERLVPLAVMPDVVLESSITGPAALLSGTGRKERAKDASGGILRKLPADGGVLLLKDFTSIIDMHRDARAEILAALREIFDGRWDRSVGVDGGRTLTWTGHLGLIAGCTTAIDSAHAVVSVMGTRFLLVRLRGDQDIAGSAFDHVGAETTMRSELRGAVRGLLEHLPGQPFDKAAVRDPLIALASYVALARSPVDRDQRSEIRLVLDPEAPTRIVKMLTQLWRASGLLGLDPASAWELVRRVGMDSIPKLRRSVLDYLAGRHTSASTTDVAQAVEHPQQTTRRALEDLAAHRVTVRFPGGPGKADRWELATQPRQWLERSVPVLSEVIAGDVLAVPVSSATVQSEQLSSIPLIETKTTNDDKTGKVGISDNLPACLRELTEPDTGDPIGAHDEDPDPPYGISREAWAQHHARRPV
jgi:hypothetical protein